MIAGKDSPQAGSQDEEAERDAAAVQALRREVGRLANGRLGALDEQELRSLRTQLERAGRGLVALGRAQEALGGCGGCGQGYAGRLGLGQTGREVRVPWSVEDLAEAYREVERRRELRAAAGGIQ